MGRRKRPFYRIVAIDTRSRRDGAEIERLGWYDPLRMDVVMELQEDRIIHWLNQGAQPSETVNNIMKEIGLKYKMHLIKEGKSEEEIVSLIAEWKRHQEVKRINQLEKKEAKKSADAKAKSAAVGEEVAEAKEKAPIEDAPAEEVVAEAKEEVPTEDAPAEEVVAEAKEEVPAEEAPSTEEEAEAKEEVPTEDTPAEEVVAEAKEEVPAEEAPATEEVSEAKNEAPDEEKNIK
jgi:small subunit ribosomal protein S16